MLCLAVSPCWLWGKLQLCQLASRGRWYHAYSLTVTVVARFAISLAVVGIDTSQLNGLPESAALFVEGVVGRAAPLTLECIPQGSSVLTATAKQ